MKYISRIVFVMGIFLLPVHSFNWGHPPIYTEHKLNSPEDSVTIVATAGNNGSISPHGEIRVKSGGNSTFTIAPHYGYVIDSLMIDSSLISSDNTYTFMDVTGNHTIEVTFSKSVYTITADAGPNGTITPSGILRQEYGSNRSFTVTAIEGYHIDKVIVDNLDQGVVDSYTFTNVATNHAIRATFAKDN